MDKAAVPPQTGPMNCDPVTLEIVRGAIRAAQAEMEALIEPARMPPMSEKCAQPMTKPQRLPSWKTGASSTWSLECEIAPREP